MGSSASIAKSPSVNDLLNRKTEQEVIKAVLPIYFTKAELTSTEKKRLVESWKMITTGTAKELQSIASSDDLNSNNNIRVNPTEKFGLLFYSRLFEAHSTANSLFTRPAPKQSTLFVIMISFIVREIEFEMDPTKFSKTMQTLANGHNRLGIKSLEYGIFGEVLFWTLKKCLGEEAYDLATHLAWIKTYSKVLSILIPISVSYELSHQKEIRESELKRINHLAHSGARNIGAEKDKSMADAALTREPEEVYPSNQTKAVSKLSNYL